MDNLANWLILLFAAILVAGAILYPKAWFSFFNKIRLNTNEKTPHAGDILVTFIALGVLAFVIGFAKEGVIWLFS